MVERLAGVEGFVGVCIVTFLADEDSFDLSTVFALGVFLTGLVVEAVLGDLSVFKLIFGELSGFLMDIG